MMQSVPISIDKDHSYEERVSFIKGVLESRGVDQDEISEYAGPMIQMVDEAGGNSSDVIIQIKSRRIKALKIRSPTESCPTKIGPFKMAEVEITHNPKEIIYSFPEVVPSRAPSQFPNQLNPSWWDNAAHTIDQRGSFCSNWWSYFVAWVIWIVKKVYCLSTQKAPSMDEVIWVREQFGTNRAGFRLPPNEVRLFIEYAERTTGSFWKGVEKDVVEAVERETFDLLSFSIERGEKSSSIRIMIDLGHLVFQKTLATVNR